MALSDNWLRGGNGKPYAGPSEVSDGDGVSVRVSLLRSRFGMWSTGSESGPLLVGIRL